MGYAYYLVVSGNLTELPANNRGSDAADAAVYFVKDHCRYFIVVTDNFLECQHDSGHFSSGGNFAEGFERFTAICRNEKFN